MEQNEENYSVICISKVGEEVRFESLKFILLRSI